MSKKILSRSRMLAAVAAIGLGCSTSQAVAGSGAVLQGLEATPGASAQVLPAISNPRPYRQVVLATCNRNLVALGLPQACVMPLRTVPAGRILELNTINCGGVTFTPSGVILFRDALKIDADHFVGVLPASSAAGAVIVSAKYYFKAGEAPRLLMASVAPTDQGICSVAGTLWSTN